MFSHFRKEFSSTIAGKSFPFHTTLNAVGEISAFLFIKHQACRWKMTVNLMKL
jgi:hypothetical protein